MTPSKRLPFLAVILCSLLSGCFDWGTPAGANLSCLESDAGSCPNGWTCENEVCVSLNCGDGVQDPLEECDWGENNSNTVVDGCRENCTEATCGDGVIDSSEACDDGNSVDDGNGCSKDCQRVGFCGDGVIQSAVESCEDGNQVNGDGCSNNCISEKGYVLIAPGSFTMGDADILGAYPREANIKHSFLMMQYEVTQRQWLELTGNNPSSYPFCKEECREQCEQTPLLCADDCWEDCPVENITWYDAIDYCNRLSKSVGLAPCYTFQPGEQIFDPVQVIFSGAECLGYRLPTEAEWEYAVRAGTTGAYYSASESSLGDPNDPCPANADLDAIGWYCNNSDYLTRPVGQKNPNEWGLYDMNGNVAEWVWDWYNSFLLSDEGYIIDDAGTIYDPNTITGPISGDDRIKKGGDKNSTPAQARSASRSAHSPNGKYNGLGLRVVRTAP